MFRALWLGQAISQLGDAFYYVVFMFMVQKVTNSSLMVGYVGALEALPFLLVGPYAGVLVDRIDRRSIMLLSDVLCGVLLLAFGASIWVMGSPPVAALLLTPFLLSSLRCFFMPAKAAAIPSLVPQELVLQANAVSSTTATGLALISLSLTATILAVLYNYWPAGFYIGAILLNAVSFLGSAAFIRLLPPIKAERRDLHQVHPLADFRDGLAYIWGRHELRVLTLLLTVFRLAVAPFFVVYLACNNAWFGGKPSTIAWFEVSFCAGLGLSSLAMTRAKPRRPLLWFSVGLAITGFTVALMAFSKHAWLFAFWNLIAGLAIPPADISIATYLQLSVPDAYRGRVNSVREMIATGITPIGFVLGGVLVGTFGLIAAFLTMGFGMMGGCLVGIADRRFRSQEMPTPVQPVGQSESESGSEVALIG
jgi:MFS family permease